MAEPGGAELTSDQVKRLAVTGAAVLLLREGLVRVVNFLGGVALARILAPEVFGVFAISTFILYFFTFFRDLGLGGAVIQRGERITEDDLCTVFTLQQAAAILLGATAAVLAPFAVDTYGLDPDATWLVRALAVAFVLGSFGTVPSLLLERRLAFDRLVAVELAGSLAYYVCAVALAVAGHGVWSLVVAVLARSVVSLVAVYLASPWKPGLRVVPRAAAEMLRFGLPFQAGVLVHFVEDSVVPTLVALLAGAQAVGYVNWATSVAFLPMLFVGVAGRVTFPAYSRLQSDRKQLGKAVERSMRLVCLGVFPSVFLMVPLAPALVQFVYTEKWEPALPAFYLFCISVLAASISATASNAVYALGKAVAMLRVTALCVIAFWGASILLVPPLQYTGCALANALVAATVGLFLPIRELKKVVDVELLASLWSPLVASVVAGGLVYAVSGVLVRDLLSLVLVGLFGGALYLGCLLLIDGRRLRAEIKEGFSLVLRPNRMGEATEAAEGIRATASDPVPEVETPAPTISAVVNTLNEEVRLARCLSALTWTDEIVVVDMHSDDGTVDVAREFTDRVLYHARTGYVEPARNFAIAQATGDWVLVVDADELVTPTLAAKLREVVEQPGAVAAVRIPRTTYNFGRPTPYISLYPDRQLRFFRRGSAHYSSLIHRPPEIDGEILDLPSGEGLDLEHRPELDVVALVQRWAHYSTAEATALHRAGVKFDWELHLIRQPLREFRFRFFACKGYKDGMRGLVLALLHAFCRFLTNATLWELSGYSSEREEEIRRMASGRRMVLRLAVGAVKRRLTVRRYP